MSTYADQVTKEWHKLVDDQILTEAQILQAGNVIDYPTYREKVGRIWGLRNAIDLFADAQSNVNKRT